MFPVEHLDKSEFVRITSKAAHRKGVAAPLWMWGVKEKDMGI